MKRQLPVKIQAKLNGSGARKKSRFGWHNTSYQSLHHLTILRPLLRSFLENPCAYLVRVPLLTHHCIPSLLFLSKSNFLSKI